MLDDLARILGYAFLIGLVLYLAWALYRVTRDWRLGKRMVREVLRHDAEQARNDDWLELLASEDSSPGFTGTGRRQSFPWRGGTER